MQHTPATEIAGAKLHDGRVIVALDMGREPFPHMGKEFRFGLFEKLDNGAFKHIEGGIMTNDRKAIKGEFALYCANSSGLSIPQ